MTRPSRMFASLSKLCKWQISNQSGTEICDHNSVDQELQDKALTSSGAFRSLEYRAEQAL